MALRSAQGMLEAAEKLAAASPRTVVYDKKRKAELAAKLAQRWQRWELSNFDYLMQVISFITLWQTFLSSLFEVAQELLVTCSSQRPSYLTFTACHHSTPDMLGCESQEPTSGLL